MPDNNLLLALYTYASQQDENFTTEAFVHLLRHLQIHEPKIACAFLDFLTKERIRFEPNECLKLQIRTQWSFSGGTPDILIRGPDHFVIVEVKVEAQPGVTQLDRYREQLKKQNERHTCLTLLSRYPVDSNEKVKADECVRWHGIGRLLDDQNVAKVSEPVSAMLIRQFLEFLRERGMAMEKVGWELTRGVQALLSLMTLLEEAIDSSKEIKNRGRLGGTGHNGFDLSINGTRCWSGVYLSRPQVLVFEAYNLPEAAAQNAVAGRIVRKNDPDFGHFEKQSKGASKWVNTLDLESENVHFFALSPDNQQLRLEEFVSTCASEIKKMT